jgi:hypothetical protein
MPHAKSMLASLSSLRPGERDIMLHKMSGISRSRQRMFNGSMFNHVLFNHVLSLAAAFGFVAFVLVFVHPASHAGRAAVHQTSAGSAVAAIAASDADVRSHLAATK